MTRFKSGSRSSHIYDPTRIVQYHPEKIHCELQKILSFTRLTKDFHFPIKISEREIQSLIDFNMVNFDTVNFKSRDNTSMVSDCEDFLNEVFDAVYPLSLFEQLEYLRHLTPLLQKILFGLGKFLKSEKLWIKTRIVSEIEEMEENFVKWFFKINDSAVKWGFYLSYDSNPHTIIGPKAKILLDNKIHNIAARARGEFLEDLGQVHKRLRNKIRKVKKANRRQLRIDQESEIMET